MAVVTIKDIAQEAGVSITTVSNVINGNSKKVSTETAKKIKDIIKKRNYIPNMGARSLVKNKSNIIGIVMNILTDEATGALYTPFVSEILGAIEKEFQDQGYYTMLYASNKSQEIEDLVVKWNVAGIITIGLSSEVCRTIANLVKIPTVYTDCYFDPEEPYHNVGTQDEEGMYEAVKYLIAKGHKKIGYVVDMNYSTDEVGGVGGHRYRGYRRAMEEANLVLNPDLVFHVEIKETNKRRNFEEIFQKSSQMTAVAFCYDYYAIEAMDYLRYKGIDIPRDLSVVGFDDIDMSKLTYPRLTTVHQGIKEKGYLAAKLLIHLLKNDNLDERDIRLPVYLVERDSVIAPKK